MMLFLSSLFFFSTRPLFPTVQLVSAKGGVGDVASNTDCRGAVRHSQHLQLPSTHLPLHSQLPPGAPADLTGEDAARHPQVSLHLLFGETFWSSRDVGHSNCRSVLCHSHIKLQKLGEERSLKVKGVALGSGSCRFCLTRLLYCNALFPITHEIS